MKRFAAAVLICALICSALSGCFYFPRPVILPPRETEAQWTPKPSAPAPEVREGDYFSGDVWRGDTAFADMEYEHYDPARFGEYTEAIYAFARQGGSQKDFDDADYLLWDELNYVYTMAVLADLRYSADPTDEEAREERLYCDKLYEELSGEYWNAMHAMAESRHSRLLESGYAQWQIDWFESYDDSRDPDGAVLERDSELQLEYYSLIAAEYPDYEAIGENYVELVELRRELARDYGWDSYAEYAYAGLYGRDYTPSDSEALWDYVRQYFVPLVEEYAVPVGERSAELYWSEEIDCSEEALFAAMELVLPRISGELFEAYEYMRRYGLYDIAYSESKMATGYTIVLYWYNQPFIFNCPYGSYYDYSDLFHEFGHFASYFYSPSNLIFGNSDNDLAELQSQGLEVLATLFYDELFGPENGDAIRADVLMSIVYSVVDGALYDEFQRRVFEEEALTPERVNEIYASLREEYGYSPAEGAETEWMLVEHNFSRPFYYISYGVSALAALELYALAQTDFAAAADKYLTVEAMDPEIYYLSDALQTASLSSPFEEESFKTSAIALAVCFA